MDFRIFRTNASRCRCLSGSYSNVKTPFQGNRYIFSFFCSDDDIPWERYIIPGACKTTPELALIQLNQ